MSGTRFEPSRRVARVASRMKFLISQVIQRELKDPRIGFITVLDVEPTEDIKEARVRVSVLGPSGARSKAEHALARAKGFIQRELGRSLKTRNTPVLRFVFDDTEDKASRIEALIQKASQEDRETTMAKKPSKKPDKPSRGAEKPGKNPSKKDVGQLDEDDGSIAQGQDDDSDHDGGSEDDTSEDDFASDFDAPEDDDDEEDEEEEEDYDEDFDEDYADEDDDLEELDEDDEEEEEEDDYGEDDEEDDYEEDR